MTGRNASIMWDKHLTLHMPRHKAYLIIEDKNNAFIIFGRSLFSEHICAWLPRALFSLYASGKVSQASATHAHVYLVHTALLDLEVSR